MEDESDWVFDSLLCFLNGPEWNAPLQSFIEEKSLIFELNVPDSEEYTKIYDEFKNLVDFMLGNFMEDMGIKPQQFEDACNRENVVTFDRSLFELIWAANDYGVFKRLMSQRNVELQLQALELIEQKYGITPQSFIPNPADMHQEGETKAEVFKSPKISPTIEQNVMEEVIKTFPETEASSSNKDEEMQYFLEEKHLLENTLITIENEKQPKAQLETVNEEEHIIKIKPYEAATFNNEIKKNSTKGGLSTVADKKSINAEVNKLDLKKRQEYLRAQRDKLVALKKEVRKKHLSTKNALPEKSKNRPKSAKAAADLLAGNTKKIEPQEMLLRKTLIERLKSEVISYKDGN